MDMYYNRGIFVPLCTEVREVFSLFDLDNDNAIPTRQVIVVLRSLNFNPAEQHVKDLIEEFDPEGKLGKLTGVNEQGVNYQEEWRNFR